MALLSVASALVTPSDAAALPPARAAAAVVREYEQSFTTYGFSDPDPIPRIGRIYPYFRFDGFTDRAANQRWKVVELENDFLKVRILPQIGGKIWNAIDKRTNRSFIYDNGVVKFRDIAMRGPWTSGGIEANYGIIGHTPNVSTPVDYQLRTNDDGSVTCIVGALDLLTRTPWRLEIRLGRDDAAFSTTSFWYNASPLEEPYYSWMNAGIKVKGRLQFIYPGTSQLGHAGEVGPWPVNGDGRDLSWYDNNNFGGYKSYHVFGQATDFVGAYWHDDDFGMVRYGQRDEKAGKKLWIWGLSRQGMIWEDLLTDRDGQYAEVQSGRLFNQSAEQSTFTPFKHRGFAPHTVDRWTEYWYPVAGTKGMVAASRVGALNAIIAGDRLITTVSPVVPINDTLFFYNGETLLAKHAVRRAPLMLHIDTVDIKGMIRDSLRIRLGADLLTYRFNSAHDALSRPVQTPPTIDWSTPVNLHIRGKEWLRQRAYDSAAVYLDQALARDPHYLPALTDRAMIAVRAGDYRRAVTLTRTALAIDTYDGAANYYYGLANRRLNQLVDAQDGFEVAALSVEFRGAAWTQLGRMALAQQRNGAATQYAEKALAATPGNLDALAVAIVAARRQRLTPAATRWRLQLEATDPLSHLARVEQLIAADSSRYTALRAGIRAELPEQTLLELAAWYTDIGEDTVAARVLAAVGDHPEALYWRAYLARGTSVSDSLIARANAQSPTLTFPFRPEMIPVFAYAQRRTSAWQPRYYESLRAWSAGDVAGAASLLMALNDTPDYAPLYAARATLRTTTVARSTASEPAEPQRATPHSAAQHDLERAITLDPNEWRYGKLLVELHLAANNAADGVRVAQRFVQRFPQHYILGLTLAKAYVAAKQFREADQLLGTLRVLPYEGAKDGHVLYRQAKLALAEQAIANKQWTRARTLIADARLWPERLGAGKPYAVDTDERWEDSLSLVIEQQSGSGLPPARSAGRDSLKYGTANWEADSLGNHRAVLQVDAAADEVRARIPWRRRDTLPDRVHLIVVSATSQQRIQNVERLRITREMGEIAFEAPTAGTYYVYYMPYTGTFRSNYPKITYREVQQTASPEWLARRVQRGAASGGSRLPEARVVGFDAVNEFSRFTEMEYIAGAAESDSLRAAFPSAPFLAFAEDRTRSIRMQRDIPHTWATRGPFAPFRGVAKRGEYYTFQVGIWAHRAPVDSLSYRVTPLARRGGAEQIPASAVTVFNLEGVDWSGRPFTKAVSVPLNAVQALWFGVDVAPRTIPGDYEGTITISSRGARAQTVPLRITVQPATIVNHGDDDPSQLTRLRWLNSQLAADDDVAAPYIPMRVSGSTISLLGRTLTFGRDGFPASIQSYFTPNNTAVGTAAREILGAPIQFVVRDAAKQVVPWQGSAAVVTKQAAGSVGWEATRSAGALTMRSQATLEFDGTAEFQIALRARERTTLSNVQLEIPLRADAARYMMGLGQKGGRRPDTFHWTWDVATKN